MGMKESKHSPGSPQTVCLDPLKPSYCISGFQSCTVEIPSAENVLSCLHAARESEGS